MEKVTIHIIKPMVLGDRADFLKRMDAYKVTSRRSRFTCIKEIAEKRTIRPTFLGKGPSSRKQRMVPPKKDS